MANFRIPDGLRSDAANKVRDKVDAGGAAGSLEIRSGTQPASANDLVTGTLLAVLTFSYPSAPNAVNGVLTFDPLTQDSAADATGTATWARAKDSAGNTAFDCDVHTSSATLNLNTNEIVEGGPLEVTSFTVTMPAG